ncbi:hypothetical protein LCGC14_0220350 [marine sediment metagenome]|uniref:Uncharacterized protein n=1 Tax=marine sediment metagenome TaxID=412755 RepID=A0A0F9UHN0_9ZZZZ
MANDLGFLEPLAVGWNDRGLGHGDYGVVDASGKLIAEIATGRYDHALLFATAPKLLEGCKKALTCNLNSDVRALIQNAVDEMILQQFKLKPPGEK